MSEETNGKGKYKFCARTQGKRLYGFWINLAACDARIAKGKCRRVTKIVDHHKVDTCEPVLRKVRERDEEEIEVPEEGAVVVGDYRTRLNLGLEEGASDKDEEA